MAHVIDAVLNLRDQFSGQLKHVTQELSNFQKKSKYVAQDIKKVSKTSQELGNGLMKISTLPILGIGVASAKTAIACEDSFVGIKKTVDATEKQFKQLEKNFDDMSLRIPIDLTELHNIGELAGQLGVKANDITKFSETIAKLGVATNLTTEEGASNLAKFANIMGMSLKDIDKLGSCIVDLGNNTATTERDIVAMAMRLAGAGKQVNLTESQIMAMSATMSSLGIEAEAGGSAMSKFMMNVNTDIRCGNESLNMYAKLCGTTATKLKNIWKKDSIKGLEMLIDGMGKFRQKGGNLSMLLDQLDIKDVRMKDTLLRMSNAQGMLTKNVNLGTKAWQENIALNKEAETKFKTTRSQIKLLRNNIKLLGKTFGNILLPYIKRACEYTQNLCKKIKDLTPAQQESIVNFAKWALIIGPVILGVSKIGKSISNTITSINRLTRNIKKAGGIMQWLTSPGHLVVLGLLAIVVVAALVITHWKQICEFTNKVKKTLINLKNNALDKVKKAFDETKKKIKKFKDALKDAEPTIKRVAKVLGAIFGPALVKTGTKAIIAGTRIMGHFVASIIKTGSQAVVNGIKLTVSFIGAIIKTGAQAVVAGARLTTTFIAAIIKTGAQAAKTAIIITGKLIVAIAKYALEGWRAVGAIIAQTAAWLFQKGVVIAHTIALVAHKIATIGLTAVTKGLTLAQWALNSAFLASPIGWIVLGIGLLVIAVIGLCKAWKENWGGIQEKTKAVIDKIKEWWGNLKEFLKHPIQGTINLLKTGNVKGEVKGKNALGTKYWGGGLSLVGEHGPEIVRLPRGAEVLDNKNTQHILNARQNINNVTNLSKYISNRHALNRNIYNNNKSNTLSKSSSTFNKKVLDNRVNNKKSISNVKNGDVHITFTGDIHVRQESDIDAIVTKIAQRLALQQKNTA